MVERVMGILTYSAGQDGHADHEPYNRFAFPAGQKVYGDDWWLVVDDLATDFHSNHDGWEASWPLEIRIYRDGQEVARFEVEREYEPTFYSRELDAPVTASQPGTPEGVNKNQPNREG
jgi:hypothetical protein